MKKAAAILFIVLIGFVTLTSSSAQAQSAYEWLMDGEFAEEHQKDIKEQIIPGVQFFSLVPGTCSLPAIIRFNLLPNPCQGIHLPPPDLSC